MPSEHDGDDWSLSDLSISEPDLECDDETETPANEPSSWAEVGDGDASEAAYRLADLNHLLLNQSNKYPFLASELTNANQAATPAVQLDAGATEPAALDYTGRATLALDVQRTCHMLFQSAQTPTRRTPSNEAATHGHVPGNATREHNDTSHPDLSAAEKGTRSLSLTTSTIKSIEKKIGRGNYRRTSTDQPESSMAAALAADVQMDVNCAEIPPGPRFDAGSEKGAPTPLHIDPNVFLRHVHTNTTLQDLASELETIAQEHAHEASAIHDLVCTHFGQFISCKNTIVDIRSALRRNEADSTSDSSATTVLLASIDDTIHLATAHEGDATLGLSERQAKASAARRALAVLRHHRALLSLPEMLHEQALLGEWEAMAHNVMSARTALGQQESTVLLKVLAACEATVATVLHDHHSGLANTNWTQDQTASGSDSTDRTQDQTASGARANASTSPDVDPRTPSLSSENVEPREPRPQRHGGQLSRWERIRNSWH
uniref:Exocyst complex component SEC5 n=1 Tax=Mantoniella antarctica TaxID=81844 RepID=A0A7S0X862_9CHLO|mmetsp:Transcript_25082/g.62749  ORF Transcript_25082/g.62749 Transcript_25082/m.62749 type:complete len:491 (+) Transcript_25082:168-1640(+)